MEVKYAWGLEDRNGTAVTNGKGSHVVEAIMY